MGHLISRTPSAVLNELRDRSGAPVALYTGAGRNGVLELQLVDRQRQPVPLGPTPALELVVKTSPDALDTELDPGMPLACTVTNLGQAIFTVPMDTVDFQTEQPYVLVILYDTAGGGKAVLAHMRSVIRKAGV